MLIELNIIVAFLLIRKTWVTDLLVRWGNEKSSEMGSGHPRNERGDDFDMNGLIPLYRLCLSVSFSVCLICDYERYGSLGVSIQRIMQEFNLGILSHVSTTL